MPKHFDVDTRRLRWLERELRVYAEERLPKAARSALNEMASRTRELWQREARESMTLRAPSRKSPWATKSISFDKVKGPLHMDSMRATTGSEAEFMRQQEVGGERVSSRKHGLPIPTGYAAGQSGQLKRTRPVRPRNRLEQIRLAAGGRSRHILVKKRGRALGIFQVSGKKKRKKLRMVYDLSHRSVSVPRNPMLQRALKRLERDAGRIQAKAMAFQLRRGRGW